MIGSSVVADTNVFIEIMKGNAGFAQKLEGFLVVYPSPFVRAELFFGAYRSNNPEKHLDKVAFALAKTSLLLVDATTAEIFVQIKLALLAMGRPIPRMTFGLQLLRFSTNCPYLQTMPILRK